MNITKITFKKKTTAVKMWLQDFIYAPLNYSQFDIIAYKHFT